MGDTLSFSSQNKVYPRLLMSVNKHVRGSRSARPARSHTPYGTRGWLLFGALHIPFAVLQAAAFFIKTQEEDVVPLGFERSAILLKVATSAIRHGAVTLNQYRLIMTIICSWRVAFFQPGPYNSGPPV